MARLSVIPMTRAPNGYIQIRHVDKLTNICELYKLSTLSSANLNIELPNGIDKQSPKSQYCCFPCRNDTPKAVLFSTCIHTNMTLIYCVELGSLGPSIRWLMSRSLCPFLLKSTCTYKSYSPRLKACITGLRQSWAASWDVRYQHTHTHFATVLLRCELVTSNDDQISSLL